MRRRAHPWEYEAGKGLMRYATNDSEQNWSAAPDLNPKVLRVGWHFASTAEAIAHFGTT